MKERFTLYLNEDILKKIKIQSVEEGFKSTSEFIENILIYYLNDLDDLDSDSYFGLEWYKFSDD